MDKKKQQAIIDATNKAQKVFLRLDKNGVKELKKAYRTASKRLEIAIYNATLGEQDARLEHLGFIKQNISNTLQDLASTRAEILNQNINNASTLAAGVFTPNINNVPHNTLRWMQAFTAEDGLQLSDRLWRIDAGAKELIGREIEQAIIMGKSATQSALELLENSEQVPQALKSKINSAKTSILAHNAKMTLHNHTFANASRVFRTELNRAYTHSYETMAFEELGDEIIGTKFMLSKNHRVYDQCDKHATADLYGLGPGIYPQGKNPCPAHPNTTSYIVVAFKDDKTEDVASEQELFNTFNGYFKNGIHNDGFGANLIIDKNLFTSKGVWKIKKNKRHHYINILPQAILNPHEILEFGSKKSKRRAYINYYNNGKKTIPLVAFFQYKNNKWIGSSIHPVVSDARETIKAGGVRKYLNERVKQGFAGESVTILK
jgi:hypothetical protein